VNSLNVISRQGALTSHSSKVKTFQCKSVNHPNSSKTKFTWLDSPRKLEMISITSFNLLGNIIHQSDTVRDIGVILDLSLYCGKHISKLTQQTCSWQLHQLWRIRRCLSPQVVEQLVHAFVTCHLDYCNSIQYDLPASHTQRLQAVLNSAARLVAGSRLFDPITPVLKSLYFSHTLNVSHDVFSCVSFTPAAGPRVSLRFLSLSLNCPWHGISALISPWPATCGST